MMRFIRSILPATAMLAMHSIDTESCSARTHEVPPVTLVEFLHQAIPDDQPGLFFIRDYIQFPSEFFPGSGGLWDSQGFVARIVDGDQVVVRFEAPAGRRLTVYHPAAATEPTLLFFSGEWRSPGSDVPLIPQGASQVTWEGLLGTAPVRTSDNASISASAERLAVSQSFTVTSSFQFQAIEIRFNAQNPPPPGLSRSYGAVSAIMSPSISAQTRVPVGADQTMMQVSSLGIEVVSIPTVTINQLNHAYFFDSSLGKFRLVDAVDFSAGGGGSFSSAPFDAAVGQGDTVVARFEAPPGHRFRIVRPPQAESLRLNCDAYFTALSGAPTIMLPVNASFEGLSGTPPALLAEDSRITADGRRIEFDALFDVPGSCEFTALELRMSIQSPIPHLSRAYSSALSFASPSFGTFALGVGLPDSIVMSIVPVPQCPGDINGDGATNTSDLTVLLANFGNSVPLGTRGDLNNDGSVTTNDLIIFLGAFGCPA